MDVFIQVYPNPTSNNLTIDLGDLNGVKTTIKLYDPSGKGRGELYTLKNLCKRESLKFDKDVRFWLNLLWNAVDDGA